MTKCTNFYSENSDSSIQCDKLWTQKSCMVGQSCPGLTKGWPSFSKILATVLVATRDFWLLVKFGINFKSKVSSFLVRWYGLKVWKFYQQRTISYQKLVKKAKSTRSLCSRNFQNVNFKAWLCWYLIIILSLRFYV